MSKKRNMFAHGSGNVVWRQSAEEATLAKKPHYNGFACGHGTHGDTKYNRAKAKRDWMRQEGASKGSFLVCASNQDIASIRRIIRMRFDKNEHAIRTDICKNL
ncbi:hypothetical protein [Adlercreutzia sp. ZJ138]|uniref:hypothetical protein n=1 Tax=Adlercreutzia sp. ZJ138 TaxID=2709405 RepID=UPI0013EC0AAE|nr:hypothetical protein [Adlercreutzia sp. ZJ138]